MTDHRSDDLTPDPLDHASTESSDWPDDYVEAVFVTRAQSTRAAPPRDPYDLGGLFSQWSWEAG